jgi:hypothetical protein
VTWLALRALSSSLRDENEPRSFKRMATVRASRFSLARNFARFQEADVSRFLIDNLKVSFSPRNPGLRTRIARKQPVVAPSAINDTSDLGLSYIAGTSVTHRGNEHVLRWRWGSAVRQQGLGAFRAGKTATLTVDTNPIRAVRLALSLPDRRRHDRNVDNYLDPRVVPAEIAHSECLDALDAVVHRERRDYTQIVSGLFGVDLGEGDVAVTVNSIELAWDVLVPYHAHLVPTFLAKAWKRRLNDGRRVFWLDEVSEGGDGVLKAQDGQGLVLKMYAKTADVARFEVQLTGKRARELVGRRLAPDDRVGFVDVLKAIAAQVFPRILAVQAEAVAPPVVPVQEVFTLLSRDPVDRYIVGALLAGNRVKSRGQSDYRRFVWLRGAGIVVRGPGKGWWSGTPALAEVAEVLRIAQSINKRKAS